MTRPRPAGGASRVRKGWHLSPRRLEQLVAIVGALLVVVGVALAYAPAGLIVAGLALIASIVDLGPRRSRT